MTYNCITKAFNECFGAKPNSNSTAASRAADGEFGPHDFGTNLKSLTLTRLKSTADARARERERRGGALDGVL